MLCGNQSVNLYLKSAVCFPNGVCDCRSRFNNCSFYAFNLLCHCFIIYALYFKKSGYPSILPSFYPGVFLELYHQLFLNLAPKLGKWTKNGPKKGFLNLLRFVINFYWICAVNKSYIICFVPAQNPFWEHFGFWDLGQKVFSQIQSMEHGGQGGHGQKWM